MKLVDIRTTVRKYTFHPEPTRWTDSDLNQFINMAYLDLAFNNPDFAPYDINVSAGQDSLDKPSALLTIGPEAYWFENNERRRLFIGNESLPAGLDSGVPKYFWYINEKIYLYPTPTNSGILRVLGSPTVTLLSADEDEPIFSMCEQALIAYTCYAVLRPDIPEQASYWESEYAKERASWINKQLAKRMKRMTMVLDES